MEKVEAMLECPANFVAINQQVPCDHWEDDFAGSAHHLRTAISKNAGNIGGMEVYSGVMGDDRISGCWTLLPTSLIPVKHLGILSHTGSRKVRELIRRRLWQPLLELLSAS